MPGEGVSAMWKRILAQALLCCALCGCMSRDEKREGRAVLRAERKNFITQAKAQYGEKIRVRNIKATSVAHWDSLWPVINSYSFSGSVEGTVIQPDGTEFSAIYYPEENVVYSTKNHDAIRESVRDFPGLDWFDYVEIKLGRLSPQGCYLSYLPDDLTTFAELLERQYFLGVYLLTTDDITGLTEEDFAELFRAFKRYEEPAASSGNLVLIQLEDPQILTEDRSIYRRLSGTYFDSANLRNTEYDRESGTQVDIFDMYGIAASLYMNCEWSSNPRKMRTNFIYKYPPGVEAAEPPADPAGDSPEAVPEPPSEHDLENAPETEEKADG